MWNIFIDIAPLKYKIGTVLASKTQESPGGREWQLHFAHLQRGLLLGGDVLLLSVVPEVLVKRGSRKCDAETGVLVGWLFHIQASLLLNHIFSLHNMWG